MIKQLGPFDLDPCAPSSRLWDTAARYYTLEDDGLSRPWIGRVWLNPPYGKGLSLWVTKLSEHGNGIAIFPLRSTDSRWFHSAVWDKGSAVLFVKGRIKFYIPEEGIEGGSCPHASIIVAWGADNAQRLFGSKIDGRFIRLN